MNPGGRFSPDTQSTSTLILAFLPRICGKYVSVVHKPLGLWCLPTTLVFCPSLPSRLRQAGP